MTAHASNASTPRHSPSARPQMAQAVPFSAASGGRYRALVVDGDAAARKSLESHLAALGRIAAVDFAAGGEAALEKAGATQYDLIFLDGQATGLGGYETCSRLRKMPAYRQTPIVMVSGKLSVLEEMEGVKAGCTAYLPKPVRAAALRDLGRRMLA